jgi:adenine specific DNA methylase Mod
MVSTLYFGDNLDVLRSYIGSETVDLIYLDPPFNSKVSYNVLYKEPSGHASAAQVGAFEDTWHWGPDAASAFDEVMRGGTPAAGILSALRAFLGENDMMAYLTMMSVRLIELHRVLKVTGSLYLHCDSTASHYLRIILDAIFNPHNFRNEIVWKRNSAHSDSKQGSKHYGRITDSIFYYSKGSHPTWNPQYRPYDQQYIDRDYRRVDESGRRYRLDNIQGPGGAEKGNPFYEVMGVSRHWRYSKEKMAQLIAENRVVQTRPGAVPQFKRYLDEMPGVLLQNLWDDVSIINNRSKEMLGYPTQKPIALLKRIILASSNPGDLVLDPFCGCGTAVHAAQELGRQWVGIDITHIAIQIILDRLKKHFPLEQPIVAGRPEDLSGARELARRDKYQFQWWASSLLGGQARGGNKKGADRGIDGELFFQRGRDTYGRAIISVKGGDNISPSMIRDLAGTRERERADMGIFVTLTSPTREMKIAAASYGTFEGAYPRIAIVTIDDLLKRQTQISLPPTFDTITVRDEARRRGPTTKVRSPDELHREPQFMLAIAGVRRATSRVAVHERSARWLGERDIDKKGKQIALDFDELDDRTSPKGRARSHRKSKRVRKEPELMLPIPGGRRPVTKDLPFDEPLPIRQPSRKTRR